MKVLVDTSCWIAAFRNENSFEASIIQNLLHENLAVTCSLVIAELLRGAMSANEELFIKREFIDLPLLTGLDDLGMKMGMLGLHLRKKGLSPGIIDLALSAIAIKHSCLIYSLDQHFKIISNHSGLKLFEPHKH